MITRDLATQLRQRQYQLGSVSRAEIDALTDDDIIDCYVTCSCCGEKQAEGNGLREAIKAARSADDFLKKCNAMSRQRHEDKASVERAKAILAAALRQQGKTP